jgi:hypothetical protein
MMMMILMQFVAVGAAVKMMMCHPVCYRGSTGKYAACLANPK